MKAKELMLGDLVTFKDCLKDEHPVIVKIWQINAYGEALVFINGSDTLDEISINDEIVGIPLTPEILEKNGFECRGAWCVPGEDLGLRQDGDSWGLLSYYTEYDALAFCHIKYVHELQHALRLCGIEKEIAL